MIGGPSATGQIVASARGAVANRLTPGPRRCVASKVWPSPIQASPHGLRGQTAVAIGDRSVAATSTISSSWEQATKTRVSSAETRTPIGSAQTKAVSYTHLRAHETGRNLVCRLLLEKK